MRPADENDTSVWGTTGGDTDNPNRPGRHLWVVPNFMCAMCVCVVSPAVIYARVCIDNVFYAQRFLSTGKSATSGWILCAT